MKVNLKLLKQLYLIHHPSRQENEMMSFIINYCYSLTGITYEIDHYNNLYITKNSTNPEVYPCLIAHMDENQEYYGEKEVLFKGDVIFGRYKNKKEQCGLGADDSNGIYVALHLLKTLPNLKVCFTVEEEKGTVGANEACYNKNFFSNVQYFIQADRRGKSDLITFSNGINIASVEFQKDITDICDKFNYTENHGTFTDIGVLVEEFEISGINVSCGYYNEHTSKEYTNLKELENCLNFIYTILTTLGNTIYKIDIKPSTYYQEFIYDGNSEYSSNYGDYGVWYQDGDLTELCQDCQHWNCQGCEFFREMRRKTSSVKAEPDGVWIEGHLADRCYACHEEKCTACDFYFDHKKHPYDRYLEEQEKQKKQNDSAVLCRGCLTGDCARCHVYDINGKAYEDKLPF